MGTDLAVIQNQSDALVLISGTDLTLVPIKKQQGQTSNC